MPLTSWRGKLGWAAAILLLLPAIGCGPAESPNGLGLSHSSVQKALDQLIADCKCKLSGSATVVGVKQTADGNGVADVKFDSFMDNTNPFYRAPWSGMGVAEIRHYRDGRNVITKLTWSEDHNCTGTAPI